MAEATEQNPGGTGIAPVADGQDACATLKLRRAGPARRAVWLALGTIVVWQLLLALFMPHELGDESHHVPAIRALASGEPLPHVLPMPPAYHWLAALPARVCGPQLWILRAFQGALGVAAVLLYAGILRRLQPDASDARVLLLAWSPLVFPHFGLVYTDLAALLAVLLALYLHLRNWPLPAAGALLLACLIRQSSVVWVLFMAVWRFAEAWQGRPRPRAGRYGPILAAAARERLWLHLLILLGMGVYFGRRGAVVPVEIIDNRPQANVAQFYLLAVVVALLWLPVWGRTLVASWRSDLAPLLVRPLPCALLVLAVGLLIVSFRNPHPWNMSRVFLHNWPLWLMTTFPLARVLAAVTIVAFVAVQGRLTWSSRARHTLLLLWLFTALFLLPHYLADTRYYIIPLVLLDVFTPYAPAESRRLAAWYLLLAVGVGAFVLSRPTHIGGP